VLAYFLTKYTTSEVFNNFEEPAVIANIFSTLFTILAGVGSILISVIIHFENQLEKGIKNFPAFEPRTVEDMFLGKLINGELIDGESKDVSESHIGNLRWFTKNNFSTEFTIVKKAHKFISCVHNILREEDNQDPLLFVLENRGKMPVAPGFIYIFYKRKDTGGSSEEKSEYIKLPGYYLEESLKHNGIVNPGEDQIFVYATEKEHQSMPNEDGYGSFEDFENFYREIEQNKEFFVIVEFTTLDKPKEKISRAYRAVVKFEKVGTNNRLTPPINPCYTETNANKPFHTNIWACDMRH